MIIDRRLFLGGAAALAAPGVARATVSGAATPAQTAAIAAITSYLEAHRAHFALPALGMVVVAGDFTATILSGTADYTEKTPLTGQELWQIGSISKSFVALICLQLVREGKMDLEADLRRIMPEARLPDDGPFTLRGLLDHTTGLADFAPAFAMDDSKLWRGFAPGTHWSYSNTGYDLVGKAIERIDGRPLAQSIEARIARPLGMTATRGAISWRDRARYPASYAVLRPDIAIRQRNALAPAPWVDASLGAGSVASTLPDMAHYLRYLIGVGTGKGAPLLADAAAVAWLARPVPQDPTTPDETYGLSLMHRRDDGRVLLHHTGGMVSFSSSFHVDAAAGTGAFASCAIGGTGYRPRLLTAYAAKAMRLAAEGKAPPPPPALAPPALPAPGDYIGSYGRVQISGDAALSVTANGKTATLEPRGPDVFVTSHPDLEAFPLLFVRDGKAIVAIDCGATRFVRNGASAPLPMTPPRIAARAGTYQSDDPWIGGVTIVARGDQLFMGGTDAITEIADDVWRAADPNWSPERIAFGGFVDGRPQIVSLSGRVLERRDG